ncbi:MAG: glycosyltransferase [Candidatus Woesearchaeota archaeon]
MIRMADVLDKKYDVCMISSRHPLKDHRIFHKETKSLINELNLNVLILAISDKEEIIEGDGYVIYGIKGDQKEVLGSVWKLFKVLRKVKAKIYHIHDFEDLALTPYLKLVKKGKIIYDMHEDYIKMINELDYMSKFKRFIFSNIAKVYEKLFVHFVHFIVVVVEHHKKKFPKKESYCIHNFPHFRKVKDMEKEYEYEFVYCGTTSEPRGVFDFLDFLKDYNKKTLLILSGRKEEREKVKKIVNEYNLNVIIKEKLPHSKVFKEISKAKIGFVLFHNSPKRNDGISTKLMEYSMCGLPILGTSFNPFMRKYIRKNALGVAIDEINNESILEGYEKILNNYSAFSKNSKEKVKNYVWDNEKIKLVDLYKKVIK